jgi:hypothetical protein
MRRSYLFTDLCAFRIKLVRALKVFKRSLPIPPPQKALPENKQRIARVLRMSLAQGAVTHG